jgi:hypothetical protein
MRLQGTARQKRERVNSKKKKKRKKETTCVLLSKLHRWRKLVSDFAERASDIALQQNLF